MPGSVTRAVTPLNRDLTNLGCEQTKHFIRISRPPTGGGCGVSLVFDF